MFLILFHRHLPNFGNISSEEVGAQWHSRPGAELRAELRAELPQASSHCDISGRLGVLEVGRRGGAGPSAGCARFIAVLRAAPNEGKIAGPRMPWRLHSWMSE